MNSDKQMTAKLTIIGASACAPTALGAASGYLLEVTSGERREGILIDCGPGVIATLAKNQMLDRVTALLVSHSHADHCADLTVLAYRRSFPEVLPPIPLIAPEDLTKRLPSLDEVFGIPSLETMKTPLSTQFDIQVRNPGESFDVAGLRVETIVADHPVPTMSIKFPELGFVYTADTAYTEELEKFASDSKFLLAECTYRAADKVDVSGHGHLDGHTVAELASQAAAQHLLVTHLADPEHSDDIYKEVQTIFPGKVTMVAPGMEFELI